LGITIIDTAFSYAAGASQEMIGSWLAADPERVNRVTIVDKVGVFEMDGELALDLSFDSVIAHAAAGRSRLGVDAVDVVMAHAPDEETPVEESLSGFGSLINDEVAGAWGVSNIDGPTLAEWLDTASRLGLRPLSLWRTSTTWPNVRQRRRSSRCAVSGGLGSLHTARRPEVC